MAQPIDVLLVDDHEVVRVGVRALLDDHLQMRVVGEAGTFHDALLEADRLVPDVILMDVRLPDGSGVEACRAIRTAHPSVHVVFLTAYADDQALITAILAGASGYLLKQTRGSELVRAIEEAAAGRSLLDPMAAERLLLHFRELARGRDERYHLTDQEQKVLDLIAEGKTNRQIADALGLAEKTVKNYVSSVLSKLQLRRRTEAAIFVVQRRPPQGDGPS